MQKKGQNESTQYLLGVRAKIELLCVESDVKVVVSDSYFLGELVALNARIFRIVLVNKTDAKHASAIEGREV